MGLLTALSTGLQRLRFRPPEYHHFRRVVIPSSRGSTEIDHLIVSQYGLFVVELKDYSGWIFGNEADAQWTSVHFGKKFRFQNPLRQNYGHVRALEELLGIPREAIHPLVVFRGRFRFKTPVPAGVATHGYSSWIAARREVLLDAATVDAILESLEAHGSRGWSARRQHTRALRERLSDDSTCPKCGGPLVMRTARRGSRPGSQFFGCSNYPRCRFTRPVHAS